MLNLLQIWYIGNRIYIMLWVRILLMMRCTRCKCMGIKVCQWLAKGRWFSPGTSVPCTDKTDCQDITEILLKVALNTITLNLAHQSPIVKLWQQYCCILLLNNKIKYLSCSNWWNAEFFLCLFELNVKLNRKYHIVTIVTNNNRKIVETGEIQHTQNHLI